MDWDSRADNYADNFLGPFAAKMTVPDEEGNCRNPILNKIRHAPAGYFKSRRIADYGCGPGNLLEYAAGVFDGLYGIDFSQRSLEIATGRAEKFGIKFFPVQTDMQNYAPEVPYDLIISVNSILPPRRDIVANMFKSIHKGLAIKGELWAILPSFDTTQYLQECMREDWEARVGKEEAARRINDFRAAKKFDPENLAYADDGIHIQCYHTPESITRDFAEADLEIIEPLRKVYYPWELTKRFDYGFFPGKEEIWDWFVIARSCKRNK